MIYFTLPDSYGDNMILNLKLLKLIKEVPSLFYDDFKIISVFGCPEGCIWDGGSTNPGYRLNKEIRITFEKYKEYNVEYWLTFTNRLLKEEHMFDTYGNAVARIGKESGICKVLVANDIMENYIRKNYPELEILQSICRCEYDIDKINEMSKRSITVLPIRHNNDFEGSLSKLEHPENIEILINEGCIELCPYNKSHYEVFNRFTLREIDTVYSCKYRENEKMALDYKERKQYVPRDLFPKYEELGIHRMKIAGRHDGIGLIPIYLDMFVKPEYRSLVEFSLSNLNVEYDWTWDKESLSTLDES